MKIVDENIKKIVKEAKMNWDNIAKPISSLGVMEDDVAKLCGIYGSAKGLRIDKRALVIMCADHGVVAEQVTQTTSEVTRIVAENFTEGKSTVNQMCNYANVDVFTVDIGMDTDYYQENELVTNKVINRKIKRGTNNLAIEDAMSIEECKKAIETGIEIVGALKDKGYKIIATGEMGIGNTTPTSILAGVLLDKSAEEVTGVGAGLSKSGLNKKLLVVKKAIERVKDNYNQDMYKLISAVGGLEIAGMVGIFLGGLRYKLPIIIDGAISSVSALCAVNIDAACADYMIASHVSGEMTGKLALEKIGVSPMIDGGLRLGEGTGAIALMPMLDMAVSIYNNMGTFDNYNIEAYERFEEEAL